MHRQRPPPKPIARGALGMRLGVTQLVAISGHSTYLTNLPFLMLFFFADTLAIPLFLRTQLLLL